MLPWSLIFLSPLIAFDFCYDYDPVPPRVRNTSNTRGCSYFFLAGCAERSLQKGSKTVATLEPRTRGQVFKQIWLATFCQDTNIFKSIHFLQNPFLFVILSLQASPTFT